MGILERLRKEHDLASQQLTTQKQLTEEELRKQAQIQELQAKLREIHEQLKTMAKPRRGLPEVTGRKRACEEDNASDLDDATSATNEQQTKIPHKIADMTDSFSVGNEHTTYVQGWQPIPQGSGAFITIPKSFKEKIWQNKFFSYRELHRAINKSNSGNPLKSFLDKLRKMNL